MQYEATRYCVSLNDGSNVVLTGPDAVENYLEDICKWELDNGRETLRTWIDSRKTLEKWAEECSLCLKALHDEVVRLMSELEVKQIGDNAWTVTPVTLEGDELIELTGEGVWQLVDTHGGVPAMLFKTYEDACAWHKTELNALQVKAKLIHSCVTRKEHFLKNVNAEGFAVMGHYIPLTDVAPNAVDAPLVIQCLV